MPIWKINFCSSVLRLSELPTCKERPQTFICCLKRLVWMRPCHFFLRREGVLGIGHLVVFLFHQCITFYNYISTSYAVNNIGGGARKVISDLNGSLGSRHFLYVMNERTSFAS